MGTNLRALTAAGATAGLLTTALLGASPAAGARAVPSPPAPRASGTAAAGTTGTAGAATVGGERLAGHGVIAPDGFKAPPKTESSAYLVADADTGAVLAAKDPHGRYLPASTLKTLTAVTLIPRLDKNRKIKPSEKACNVEGSAVGIVPEPIYKIDDLMRALLMVSANDAAVALAEANGGLPRTLADMNRQARKLQAYDTVAKTPNGLDAPGQRSSAYDLALIARAGLAMPAFREYISTKVAKFPAPKDYGKKKKKKHHDDSDPSESPAPAYYEMANHNRLLGRYKGMLGVKNGWTSKALGSFVGAARRDGHTIIVVIMHHPGGFWEEVSKLLDWGFAARSRVSPIGELVRPVPDPAPSSSALAVRPGRTPGAADGSGGDARRVAGKEPAAGGSGMAVPLLAGGGALAALALGGAYALRRRRRTPGDTAG
ncbi:D-alanyl-D-alanine carboxypeptidase family protein [Microbispora triticiradicis]|uniref:D-alanyl-D-alanine carboxypeptidase n=2 Tax=Microbispora TaxID=2005 RepID=A0ABY3M436_9ACTN|nr:MULTISPECIES: D-alanyl-D-alanine carboxypeptidase [Microbispora]TLP62217.1 D-alanyl-D-alanine carboxypeptidase [Microbispora fusca]TYB66325.1 D-alanyl-D-alanine carboxypeptidase [Microbispora tritici]